MAPKPSDMPQVRRIGMPTQGNKVWTTESPKK